MIEKTICDYLHRKVNIPAYPEKPEEPCERYILVERTEFATKEDGYPHASLTMDGVTQKTDRYNLH